MTKEEEIILTQAREKFMRDGFSKTTVEDIAKDLRMSKKTIYKYFPSKEKLMNAAISFLQKQISGHITKILDSDDNAVLKIFNIFEFIGKLLEKIDERAIQDFKYRIPDVWEKIDHFRTNLIQNILTKVIDQGKSEGLIIEYPTEIIMAIYTAGLRDVINPDFIMNNKFSIEDAKNITIDIMMNAILTDKGKEIYNKSKAGK